MSLSSLSNVKVRFILKTSKQIYNHQFSYFPINSYHFYNSLVNKRCFTNNLKREGVLSAVDKTGTFQRPQSSFRDSISSASGAKFPPEKNRYHLYASYACPWAHRVLITIHLKGLTDIIPVTIVHWHMGENGWRFSNKDEDPACTPDTLNGAKYLRDVYFKADPNYTGRFTVPVLWDKKNNTIVNNESSEIIRMLYKEFDSFIPSPYKQLDFYPDEYKSKIDEINSWIYDTVNNGVYKAGFATTQEAYEKAVYALFNSLDIIENILKISDGDYLLGKTFTEADLRLYTTIIRFDPVYVQHFKTNIGTIRHNYPNINKWLKHLYYDIKGFKETTNFSHIKKHYTKSHPTINPLGITPVGPIPNIEPK